VISLSNPGSSREREKEREREGEGEGEREEGLLQPPEGRVRRQP